MDLIGVSFHPPMPYLATDASAIVLTSLTSELLNLISNFFYWVFIQVRISFRVNFLP